jgi:hypothetical protein
MRFLCQVWHDGTKIDAMPPADKAALDSANLAYDRELQRNGHFLLAQALQSPRTAVTVKVRDGGVSATDGPFIETKEHLGGFILIEAKDMDEAIRIAAGDPMAELGGIEIRPIMERSTTGDAYDYGTAGG